MDGMQTAGARGQSGSFRRVSAWFCWAVAAILCLPGAALTVLRLIQADMGTPWIQLLSLFPASIVLTTAALAAAVLAVCLRSRPSQTIVAAVVTALLLVQLHMVAPGLMPGDITGTAPQGAGTAGASAQASASGLGLGLRSASGSGSASGRTGIRDGPQCRIQWS
jgi:hypothetical protein